MGRLAAWPPRWHHPALLETIWVRGLWMLGATGSYGRVVWRAGSGLRRGHKEANAAFPSPPATLSCSGASNAPCRAVARSLAPLSCRTLARGLQHDHEWDHSSERLLAPGCAAKETKAQAKKGRLARMNSARKAFKATAVGFGDEEVVL